jgi:hypothetical protein
MLNGQDYIPIFSNQQLGFILGVPPSGFPRNPTLKCLDGIASRSTRIDSMPLPEYGLDIP